MKCENGCFSSSFFRTFDISELIWFSPCLGDGSYSSVYQVRRIADQQIYALKKVTIQNLTDREKENALNEVRILASIKNPFVAGYKEAFFDEPSNSLCIVMEFADDGDVFQRICEYKNNKQYYKEKYIWKTVIQVVAGLKNLHALNILHRDMKSANIFLYKDTSAKLGDLNVSKVAKKGLLYTQTGTPYYASPEVWKDQPYDLKSDIWSLGCVTYEMCHLKPPFQADDMNGLFKRVLKGQYPPIPSHYSMDMRMLIK